MAEHGSISDTREDRKHVRAQLSICRVPGKKLEILKAWIMLPVKPSKVNTSSLRLLLQLVVVGEAGLWQYAVRKRYKEFVWKWLSCRSATQQPVIDSMIVDGMSPVPNDWLPLLLLAQLQLKSLSPETLKL